MHLLAIESSVLLVNLHGLFQWSTRTPSQLVRSGYWLSSNRHRFLHAWTCFPEHWQPLVAMDAELHVGYKILGLLGFAKIPAKTSQ